MRYRRCPGKRNKNDAADAAAICEAVVASMASDIPAIVLAGENGLCLTAE